jgi:hypothetical protein
MERDIKQPSITTAQGEFLTLIDQRVLQLTKVDQERKSLEPLANYFRFLESGRRAEVDSLANIIGSTLTLNEEWSFAKYSDKNQYEYTDISSTDYQQVSTSLTLVSKLSTREQYLLGIPNPSKGTSEVARSIVKQFNMDTEVDPDQVEATTKFAKQIDAIPPKLQTEANLVISNDDSLNRSLTELAQYLAKDLNPQERKNITEEAGVRKMQQMKTTVTDKQESNGRVKEFDAYTVLLNQILQELQGAEQNQKDVKAKAKSIANDRIQTSLSNEEIMEVALERLTKRLTKEIIADSTIEAVKLAVLELAPKFIPWISGISDKVDLAQIEILAESFLSQTLDERIQKRLKKYQQSDPTPNIGAATGESDLLQQSNTNEYSQRNIERVFGDFYRRESNGLVIDPTLPPTLIVQRYLEQLQKISPNYFQEVRALADQFPNMDPRTKYIVAMPVVGFGGQSKATILRTLQTFDNQTDLDGSVEINCFVNKPPQVEFDETADLINGFMPTNPDVKVAAGKLEVARNERSRPLMGKIRALQIDAILFRAAQSFSNNETLPIILNADDDTEWINPDALSNYGKRFNEVTNLDLIIGELRFDSLQYPSAFFPPFFVADELMYLLPQLNKGFANQLSEKLEPLSETEKIAFITNLFSSTFTKGLQINYAFRPEAYAKTGGAFNVEQDVNELDYMVRSIAIPAWRDAKCNIGALGEEVKVLSSSRRAMLEYLEGEGRAPIEQWRGAWEIRVNDPARIKQPEDLLGVIPISELSEQDTQVLIPALENQINRTLNEYKPPEFVDGWYGSALDNYLDALAAIGLERSNYDMDVSDENGANVVQIRLKGFPVTLLNRIRQQQEQIIKEKKLQLETVGINSDQTVQGTIVRKESGNGQIEQRRILRLPLN